MLARTSSKPKRRINIDEVFGMCFFNRERTRIDANNIQEKSNSKKASVLIRLPGRIVRRSLGAGGSLNVGAGGKMESNLWLLRCLL